MQSQEIMAIYHQYLKKIKAELQRTSRRELSNENTRHKKSKFCNSGKGVVMTCFFPDTFMEGKSCFQLIAAPVKYF